MSHRQAAAPFYLSRHRLQTLSEMTDGGRFQRARDSVNLKGFSLKAGPFQVALERGGPIDQTSVRRLDQVLTWLTKKGDLGPDWQAHQPYAWIEGELGLSHVKDPAGDPDHVVLGGAAIAAPLGWTCLLAGTRRNLLGPEAAATTDSSPLGLQKALTTLLAGRTEPPPGRFAGHDSCTLIDAACEQVLSETGGLTWTVGGVVEVLRSCTRDQVLLSAPLFLCQARTQQVGN